MHPEKSTHNGITYADCRVRGRYAVPGSSLGWTEELKAHPEAWRCQMHQSRNPCVIEGCSRSTAARQGILETDGWMCAEHWRRYVPPRSPLRRAYSRFFRIAKREGWSIGLRNRYWRFWAGLVARARRQSTEGRLDMAEINAMFGWTDDD